MDKNKEAKSILREYRTLKKELSEIDIQLNQFLGLKSNRDMIVYLHTKIKKKADMCSSIDRCIEILPEKERNVLRYRYILGLPWADVGEKIGYSWAQTYRYHKKALEIFYEAYIQQNNQKFLKN